MSHVGKTIFLRLEMKKEESGFLTMVKLVSQSKQFWRKMEAKIEHLLKKTQRYSKEAGREGVI